MDEAVREGSNTPKSRGVLAQTKELSIPTQKAIVEQMASLIDELSSRQDLPGLVEGAGMVMAIAAIGGPIDIARLRLRGYKTDGAEKGYIEGELKLSPEISYISEQQANGIANNLSLLSEMKTELVEEAGWRRIRISCQGSPNEYLVNLGYANAVEATKHGVNEPLTNLSVPIQNNTMVLMKENSSVLAERVVNSIPVLGRIVQAINTELSPDNGYTVAWESSNPQGTFSCDGKDIYRSDGQKIGGVYYY